MKGDTANLRTDAEEARKAFEEQLRAAPNDAQRHVLLGLALAYLGQKDKAIREGQRGVALRPASTDALNGPYMQHQLVRIYILVAEPERALDQLEPLLKIPYYLSPGWLKIDPNFDPLRKNPRFQKLVAGKGPQTLRRYSAAMCRRLSSFQVERKSGGTQPTQAYSSRLDGLRESLPVGSFRFL